ncbi:hypothetical protein PC110_g20304 [Phytophthora cactorum]|uniref:Ankyrin repeat-containing domain n=1 Tax=Phytophthora cactorum TaxID=29920 RepID=A0A329REV2_9STRA|nr:hypothetical protein PC110_g20304 [Phytophthora cactorum]
MLKRQRLDPRPSPASLPFLNDTALPHAQALVCIRVVWRNDSEALRLPHVVASLHAFLDWSREVSPPRVCRANFIYLLRRKHWILANEPANSSILHPKFRQYQFSEPVANSINVGNMEMVQLLSTHFTECYLPREAFVYAAELDRVEIAHWLVDNHDDTSWDADVVGIAIAENHFDLAKWICERIETPTALRSARGLHSPRLMGILKCSSGSANVYL